jgi:hypothetical protein
MTDPRDEYIAKVVKGKSFADVGGLWGLVNEKVSVAYQYGASELAMIDRVGLNDGLWQAFEQRRRVLGLPEVCCISSDITAIADAPPCSLFDVVHCSGVLYHTPDPVRFLVALRNITAEHLILGSLVTATKIESDLGSLQLPEAGALFVPALQREELEILNAYWRQFVGDGAVGLTSATPSWQLENYTPWWWLPTVEALKAMCVAAGFQCQEG